MDTNDSRRERLVRALRSIKADVALDGAGDENDFLHSAGKKADALLYVPLFLPGTSRTRRKRAAAKGGRG